MKNIIILFITGVFCLFFCSYSQAQDEVKTKIIVDLVEGQSYQLKIDGEIPEGVLRNRFVMMPRDYLLSVNSYGYLQTDTIVTINENNTDILIYMVRDPAYLKYVDELKAYKSQRLEQVFIPVIAMSSGLALSVGMYVYSMDYQNKKEALQIEYNQAGPNPRAVDTIKERLEKLKRNTIAQRHASIVIGVVSAASSYLVMKSIKKFKSTSQKPTYTYAPGLTMQIDGSSINMGLSLKINF